jgi:hypothetical protein
MLVSENPQVLLDDADVECGMEHPKLEGNYCIHTMYHAESHEDLDGNEWFGNNYD